MVIHYLVLDLLIRANNLFVHCGIPREKRNDGFTDDFLNLLQLFDHLYKTCGYATQGEYHHHWAAYMKTGKRPW